MLSNLIGGFVVIIVGVTLLPVIANQIYSALNYPFNSTLDKANPNITGAPAAVVNLLTLFYALGLMSTGVAITVSGLKQAGVM